MIARVLVSRDIYRESDKTPWILSGIYVVKSEFDDERLIIFLGDNKAITLIRREECEEL